MLRHGLAIFPLVALSAACGHAEMVVPPNLASSPLAVSRHDKTINIGDYTILAETPRSKVKRTSYSVIMTDEQILQQHLFGFDLAVEGDVIDKVSCERDSKESSYSNGVHSFNRSRHELHCTLKSPDGTHVRGHLDMSAKQSVFSLKGEMLRSQVALELVPTKHHAISDPTIAGAFAPAGYEIRLGGVLVGAVKTLDGDQVWVEERAPAWLRKYVVIVAGVLMLHADIVDNFDRTAAVSIY